MLEGLGGPKETRKVRAGEGKKGEAGRRRQQLQMMPYLAKSLSSMSPKASHGHTTVMSVPRPSMPGMSSPNLKERQNEAAGSQFPSLVIDMNAVEVINTLHSLKED